MHEALAEFALGGLDGSEQAEVTAHVEGCPRCRAELHELAELADRVLVLAPEVEPPRGFGDRVLQAMVPERHRRGGWWAAAALVVLLAGTAGVIVGRTHSGGSTTATAGVGAAARVHTVAMTTGSGAPVGWVDWTGKAPTALQVSVNYAVPDGTYTLELRVGARTRQLRDIVVVSGQGAWSGPVPGNVTFVAMVDAAGRTVCSAELA